MPPVLPFRALETTLPNGLHVIALNTGFPNLVSLQIPVQTGSRNEVEVGKSGFAHFFEHMMFRGTERYPADAYQEIITRSGARQNAYTTDTTRTTHPLAKEDLIVSSNRSGPLHEPALQRSDSRRSRAVLANTTRAPPTAYELIEVQRDHAYATHTTSPDDGSCHSEHADHSVLAHVLRQLVRPNTLPIIAGDIDRESATAMVDRYWTPAGGGLTRRSAAGPSHTSRKVHHHWYSRRCVGDRLFPCRRFPSPRRTIRLISFFDLLFARPPTLADSWSAAGRRPTLPYRLRPRTLVWGRLRAP